MLSQPEINPHIESRFWALVTKGDDCWEWHGHRWEQGYGCFKIKHNGKWQRFKAHRIAYYLATGEYPERLVCHRCDNPPCCNPAHLFEGSNAENLADMVQKGRAVSGLKVKPWRAARGEGHAMARLTEAQALEIRSRYRGGSRTQSNAAELAEEFGVTRRHIWQIAIRRTWKHI